MDNLDIWQKGDSLGDALSKFCKWKQEELTPLIETHIPISPQLEKTLNEFQKVAGGITAHLSSKLNYQNSLYKKLENKTLIGIGYQLPRTIQDQPFFIPQDVWCNPSVNWKESTVSGAGLTFISVRILKKIDLEKYESQLKTAKNKIVGRPSHREIILRAYSELKENNKIDFLIPLKSHTDLINAKINQLQKNSDSVDYKTIHKYIGGKFQDDREIHNL